MSAECPDDLIPEMQALIAWWRANGREANQGRDARALGYFTSADDLEALLSGKSWIAECRKFGVSLDPA